MLGTRLHGSMTGVDCKGELVVENVLKSLVVTKRSGKRSRGSVMEADCKGELVSEYLFRNTYL